MITTASCAATDRLLQLFESMNPWGLVVIVETHNPI
jgi:hypothetical protein